MKKSIFILLYITLTILLTGCTNSKFQIPTEKIDLGINYERTIIDCPEEGLRQPTIVYKENDMYILCKNWKDSHGGALYYFNVNDFEKKCVIDETYNVLGIANTKMGFVILTMNMEEDMTTEILLIDDQFNISSKVQLGKDLIANINIVSNDTEILIVFRDKLHIYNHKLEFLYELKLKYEGMRCHGLDQNNDFILVYDKAHGVISKYIID